MQNSQIEFWDCLHLGKKYCESKRRATLVDKERREDWLWSTPWPWQQCFLSPDVSRPTRVMCSRKAICLKLGGLLSLICAVSWGRFCVDESLLMAGVTCCGVADELPIALGAKLPHLMPHWAGKFDLNLLFLSNLQGDQNNALFPFWIWRGFVDHLFKSPNCYRQISLFSNGKCLSMGSC